MGTACWREIGVWGDRSCPQLPPVVHCSNCSVFTGEARALLERPVDPAYLAWLTESVATRAEEAAAPAPAPQQQPQQQQQEGGSR